MNTTEKEIKVTKKSNKTERLKIFGFIFGCLGFIGVMFSLSFALFKTQEENYNKVYYNPPTIDYVEEDLEPIFMTTFVVVYNFEDEGEAIFYDVKANGLSYRVLYVIKSTSFLQFKWKYHRHIQIGDIIDE